MICSELETHALKPAKSIVVIVVYRRKTWLLKTAFVERKIFFADKILRCDFGSDSSSLSDQINATMANNTGVRKTIRHDATERMAKPKNGANTGVDRKIVKIKERIFAI
ncbi:hypothetical protein GCM10023231_23680 [Olivibacter ginsenosidimutans]|uniref:Uncharacterized protein n=1 Tax=Olivibacter ginsenosidimutans TaxID=1176537 RepID=A0ABP9BGC6_9SPHI